MGFIDELNKSVVSQIAELYKIHTKQWSPSSPSTSAIPQQGTTYYYTSYQHDIEYDYNTYIACPIKRSNTERNDKFKTSKMTITVPLKAPVTQYLTNNALVECEVEIILYMPQKGYSLRAFKGYATKFPFNEKRVCQVELEETFTLRGLEFPPDTFHSYCNNALFDTNCSLSSSNFQTVADVTQTANNGTRIYADEIASYSGEYWEHGRVQYEEQFRFIMPSQGIADAVDVQIPFFGLSVGETIAIFPGCDKSPATCKNKFNNFSNFRGFPYIPTKNPSIYGL